MYTLYQTTHIHIFISLWNTHTYTHTYTLQASCNEKHSDKYTLTLNNIIKE